MTQLTEIPTSWITISFLIRLILIGALIYWTTRWENGTFWSMKDDKAGWTIGVIFVAIHFGILPMWKLAQFHSLFAITDGTIFVEYFLYDFLFRIISLLYWGVIYALILAGLNMCVHYLPNVGPFIRTVATVLIISLCIYPGCWLMFVWPFTIQQIQ